MRYLGAIGLLFGPITLVGTAWATLGLIRSAPANEKPANLAPRLVK
jgi:hypothetical protein